MAEAPLVRGNIKHSAPGNPASETPANDSRGHDSRVAGLHKSRLYSRVTARFLYWFLGFALLPLIVLAGVSLHQAKTAIHDEALQKLMLMATETHYRVEDYIRQVKEASQRASSEPYVRTVLVTASQSPARVRDSLAGLLRDRLQPIFGPEPEVSILNKFGRVVVSTEPHLMGADLSWTDHFLKGEKAAYLSDIFYDTVAQQMTWMASSPVAGDDGTLLGVIVNRIDPRRLSSLTNGRRPERNDAADDSPSGFKGRIYLVSRDGLLLTEAPFFPGSLFSQVVDTKPVRYARDSRKAMCGEYADVRRVRVAGATEIVADCGWVVIAEMDYEQAMAPYARFRNGIFILSMAVFALMLVLVLRLGAIVVRPLRALILAEQKLATEGQAGAVVPEEQIPDDEMGELIRRRNDVIRRVLAAEKRHRDLVDEIDGIAWEAEVGTWRFTFVNRRAGQILGYSVEQWLSEPGFWVKHLHPLDRSRAVQAYLEASITGNDLQLEYRMIASDGRAVWLHDQAHLVESATSADGRPVRQLRGLMIDITPAKQAQELLQESERRSRMIIDMSHDAVIGIDSKGNVSVFNHAAEQIFQVPAREIIGTPPVRLVPEDLRDRHVKAISRYLETGRSSGVIDQPRELRGLRNDGSVFPMEISLTPTNDKTIRVLATIQDITARKKAEEELLQRHQQIEGLHNLTDAVMRAETVGEIYAQAMSCVRLTLGADRASILLSDPDGPMRFKAWDGLSEEYRAAIEGRMPWREDDARPRPLVVSDVHSIVEEGASQPTILSRTDLEELRPLMLGEGIRALSAIPLVYQDRLLGRLMVYFDTPHVFTEEEVQFAQTVAAHVAFAIGRQRANDVLRAIIDGTSPSTGAEFFRVLVRHLANALHVRWAFIGESVGAGSDRIRTLALWAGGDYAANFEYDLTGTPCEGVMGRAMCCYPRGVAQMFPQDPLLAEMGVESYVGFRLSDSNGDSLGILVVMNDAPIHELSQIESILSVFAARAGAELERIQAEQRLKREQQWYRSMSEQIGEAFFICDADTGRLFEANPAFQVLSGYSREELLAMTLYELGFEDRDAIERYVQHQVSGSSHTVHPARYRRRDGHPVDVEVSTSLFAVDQRKALFVVVRPVDQGSVCSVSTRATQESPLTAGVM